MKVKYYIALALVLAIATADDEYKPKTYQFETKLDHYASNGLSPTFNIRYLVSEEFFDQLTGPILFYAGNEGNVENFYKNTGFMAKTLAKEFSGLVVFGEHRYFGQSYPFPPKEAFVSPNTKWLTVEQTMMDYVELIKHIKAKWNMEDRAVIVFGGSYGGMLAAWLRMKFP